MRINNTRVEIARANLDRAESDLRFSMRKYYDPVEILRRRALRYAEEDLENEILREDADNIGRKAYFRTLGRYWIE